MIGVCALIIAHGADGVKGLEPLPKGNCGHAAWKPARSLLAAGTGDQAGAFARRAWKRAARRARSESGRACRASFARVSARASRR